MTCTINGAPDTALAAIEGQIVVVGDSYGGAVISEDAACAPGVSHSVYVAAIVPDVGETLSDVEQQFGVAVNAPTPRPNPPLGSKWTATVSSCSMTRSPSARSTATAPPKTSSSPRRDCRDRNPLSLAQRVRRAAWRSVPSTCVVCLRDQALAVPMQRWLAQRAHSQLLEMETSHSPFVSAPDSLAALIADIAHRTGG